ncbi:MULTISPECIES: DUF1367 family protein [Brenneria]|uniref:DUF1367 domain-containing protein n=1 Tax=Brenneria nigrifluens DSM 30175 = ATCC 13028 TaxID=1121120 RepID=A0A2U1UUU0_9GAMM|nr:MULTISPECIES: DUF1367 family protein [Brenneria]EHD22087.1 protein of unknown function DUF1367 [Brenneria sp. EniD312]PWC25417.1 DUF1367 domain-containing protein [Brenneria nigrifluens DSM 30175 = ATCC 13028]QCR05167.1 DUF1367 family protein [Brenneria nigrifluens] [Brenneria nigrifluens DSM 30175 = ATCC 13028]
MAQFSFLKSAGGVLIPATPDSKEYVQKLKLGAVIYADFKQARNPAFHRKYFSLLNLGFEYWQPTGGTISPAEKKLVRGYVKFLAHFAGSEDALQTAAEEYLDGVAKKRGGDITGAKSFEAFRRWTTIESGHYDVFELPDGSLHKEPRSISFAKMDEIEFHDLYKATLDVLWSFILSKTFPTQQAAENAAAQLLEYAA